jgi:[glutamine synthetase] adenylyltransferase / [glutamine synthetase]-adenylyl-L-tyrosine phosphorylase
MRELVAKEKPPASHWDLKLAPGGLVDIEFAVQYLIMGRCAGMPGLLHPNIGTALARLAAAKVITQPNAEALREAWRLQSSLAQMIALGETAPFDPEKARKPFKSRLAKIVELPDFAVLDASLRDFQQEAHKIMTALLKD